MIALVSAVRYVRVQGPISIDHPLSISQFAVFDLSGINIALSKSVVTTSQYKFCKPENAIDGSLESRSPDDTNTCPIYQSDPSKETFSVWEIDLGRAYDIGKISYFNRDDCCQDDATGKSIIVQDVLRNTRYIRDLTNELEQEFKSGYLNCQLHNVY
jgi:hypothetical protein